MNVKDAYYKALDTLKMSFGDEGTYFTLLGWKSAESGKTRGPFLIHVLCTMAIEIDRRGKFKNSFSADATGYYPWVENDYERKERKSLEKAKELLKDL